MPYVETLKVLQTGNTSVGIFETLALLLNVNRDMRRVSFIRDRGDSRLSVGDSLELTSPTTGKQRKRRWWEQEKETGQLRLPFSLYEPAEVLRVEYDSNRRRMRLKLRFVNVDGVEKTLNLYHDGHTPLDCDGIKAIRVHEVIKKWVGPREEEAAASPFSDSQSLTRTPSSEQRYDPSRRDCEDSVERAMEHGIAVTATHRVYDDVTGEYVGKEFEVLPLTRDDAYSHPYRLDSCTPDLIRYVSFRRLNGSTVNWRINHSRIRFVDSRTPSGTECHNMLEVAMHNGVVVTPSGKVYDRESGIFLGDNLQLTSGPEMGLFDGTMRRYSEDTSIRGDMVMPNGERWGFQTHHSNVTHIDRETYVPPAESERERQWQSESFMRNYSLSGGSFSNWVDAAGVSFRQGE
jgi:hypothetical protein